MKIEDNLAQESKAFDSQIEERMKIGHIPDLRYTTSNDNFRNNIWRRPEYVDMSFGEIFRLIKNTIDAKKIKGGAKVLEVGCGPGFMSLELARAGHSVVGLDLSPECIRVANEFAQKDPHKSERGDLKYIAGDFFTLYEIEKQKYDAVVFVGALHHFADQDNIMKRVKQLLNPNGVIIAHEPTRDRVTRKNAALVNLIKVFLSINKGYFEEHMIPANKKEIESITESTYRHLSYETETGEKAQSVNDNEAGFKEMYTSLTKYFIQKEFVNRYAFFQELIGGLRFDENTNAFMANYLKEIDSYFCELGIIDYTEFYFVGKAHE